MENREKNLFYLALGLCFLASVVAVWAVPLLPMQDATQHLFESWVLATYDDPAYNWKDYYLADFTFGPYSLLYNLLWLFMKFISPVNAGKMFITLALALTLYLVVKVDREDPWVLSPWPLLLAFPLFFTHVYYYGFLPILLGVPLSLILLSDVENLKKRNYSVKEWCVTGIFVYALFASHPSSILAFFLLGSISSLSVLPDKRKFLRSLAPVGVLLAFFIIWYLIIFIPSEEAVRGPDIYSWSKFSGNLVNLVLPFTGMNFLYVKSYPDLFLWLTVFSGALFSVFMGRRSSGRPGMVSLFFAVSLAWVFCMPFWFGKYSFFNERMLPYVYWFMALLLTRLSLNLRWGAAILVISLSLTGLACKRNLAISSEKEELLPLLSLMEKNRKLMPVKFRHYSEYIEPGFFDIHVQDAIYYHLLIGGGAHTNLFRSTMRPVRFKKETGWAEDFEPEIKYNYDQADPDAFTVVQKYASTIANWSSNVDYLLVRGGTERMISYLSNGFAMPVRQSGLWILIARDQSLLKD